MFWGYVSTENCRSQNMQFLGSRCFPKEKQLFLMFATCTENKKRLIFGGQLCCQKKAYRKFGRAQFFGLKHDVKERRHPKSIKKHFRRCSPRLPFRPQVDFHRIWSPWREPQNLLLAQNVAWKLQKSERRISCRSHTGSPRCGFLSKSTFWFVFTSAEGIQAPLWDAFWHLKVPKAEGLYDRILRSKVRSA